ncbi:IS3 family transposase [[Mycoplasma] testudinis]|uniref:IS3 family transposase n=1 Tax=[Mycoplasma] testudinis TaxID=33924 RepID=UPI0004892B3E|nr:IS3 family transposase [[Mycoplasma] testudinis]
MSDRFPIQLLINIIGIPESTYYDNVKATSKPDKYSDLRKIIQIIHKKSKKTIGYKPITDIINKSITDLKTRNYYKIQNFKYWKEAKNIGKNKVLELIQEMELKHKKIKRHYSSYEGGPRQTIPNRLLTPIINYTTGKIYWKANFNVTEPYKVFATDITMFFIGNQKLYFSPLIDLFNGEVVSHTISTSPDAKMVCKMVEIAVQKIGVDKMKNAIIHSDQGSQYCSNKYMDLIKKYKILQSMSRKERSGDNAIVENFFWQTKKWGFLRIWAWNQKY